MSQPSSDPPRAERGPDEVFCRHCGAVIDERAELCPECGVRQRPPPKSSLDAAVDDLLAGGNPFVAALLSAIFPGLGQLYNRELERGLVFAVASVVAAFSIVAFVGIVLYPAVWLYAIYDAYTRAELRAEAVRAEAARSASTDSPPVDAGETTDSESPPAADPSPDDETAERSESTE